jgi:hypothetical protein
MRFWWTFLVREIAGWILVLCGLFLFLVAFGWLSQDPPLILRAPIVTVIGIFLFRGGIHLLKVAVAARVCMQAVQHGEAPAGRPVQRGSSRSAGRRQPASREEM